MNTTPHIDDGGPAFPMDQSTASAWAVFEHSKKPLSDSDFLALKNSLLKGMSLRDWFAGMALQGWLASYDGHSIHPTKNETEKEVARQAFIMADAMLAARKEGA